MHTQVFVDDPVKIGQNFAGKHIISIRQFDPQSLEILFHKTSTIKRCLQNGEQGEALAGKVITLLFFEPSSRTFSSFSAAIKRLGGQTIEYQNPMQTSSAIKGETLEDTVRVFEGYSDGIVMRHFEEGAPARAAKALSRIPIMNAGDGSGEHPTQALLDMFTLYEKFGRLDHLKGVIAGDLLYGRTVHSLLKGLSFYPGNTFYLLSPKELRLPRELFEEYTKARVTLVEIEKETDIPTDCQVWYWTRVQKERLADPSTYEVLKNRFIVTKKLLKEKGNADMIIMHPLPRVGEIDPAIDTDPRAYYLTHEVPNGMYVRMALLSLVFGK
ncbi:aspartate carbamoyltransferase [Candidatus Roizmanbacteria bacterium]|nr:aspartate carbamoyltransferase [Candidatus Roizmanbacteria bacterium]